ncbi:MAG TPA: hypothetical protein VN229_04115 [Terriglobales bacterium]|nr:hypothetical protein [Terriglobales bacterium]
MTKTWPETEARTAEDPRNADDRGAIVDRIVVRSKVANDRLAPLVLASLMSTAPVCTRDQSETAPQSAEGVARQREVPVDDLLADPMMSALWQAYAISAADVRQLVTDVTDRLRSGGELHRRAEALIARCA